MNPKNAFLGMYDGNVAVYDLKDISKGAIYTSQGVNGKHLESVAAVISELIHPPFLKFRLFCSFIDKMGSGSCGRRD